MGATDNGSGDGEFRAFPALSPEASNRRRDDAAPGVEPGGEVWLEGSAWRLGTDQEVRWISTQTEPGTTITSAVPALFDAYATLIVPDDAERKRLSDNALLELLRAHTPDQPWWIGYLETGASDVVFPDAPRVQLYSGWDYVLVKAGPDQAASWRTNDAALPWHSALPELMFPEDRSWLVSTLWDDDWSCVGGPTRLVTALLDSQAIAARAVVLDEDATPPGHRAL